jgi:hypothetical protein
VTEDNNEKTSTTTDVISCSDPVTPLNTSISIPSGNGEDAAPLNNSVSIPSGNGEDATSLNTSVSIASGNGEDATPLNNSVSIPSGNDENATSLKNCAGTSGVNDSKDDTVVITISGSTQTEYNTFASSNSDANSITPNTNVSGTITPDASSTTTPDANITVTTSFLADTSSIHALSITTSDTAIEVQRNDSTGDSTISPTSGCCHSDPSLFVPAAIFERVVDSLRAEITALKSSLAEARQRFNIELDHVSTVMRNIQSNPQPTQNTPLVKPPKATLHMKGIKKTKTNGRASCANCNEGPIAAAMTPDNPTTHQSAKVPLLGPASNHPVSPGTLSKQSEPPVQLTDNEQESPQRPVEVDSVPIDDPHAVKIDWAQPFDVFPGTETLILGDSVVRGLHENKMSVTHEETQVISVSGLNRSGLIQRLNETEKQTNIKTVVLHIGINDCKRGYVIGKNAWRSVVNAVRRCFPQATILMSSVLPYNDWHQHITATITSTNASLSEVCAAMKAHTIDNDTTFYTQTGELKTGWYHDAIHPNKTGTSGLAVNIKRAYSSPLRRDSRYYPQQRGQQQKLMYRDDIGPRLRPPFTERRGSNYEHSTYSPSQSFVPVHRRQESMNYAHSQTRSLPPFAQPRFQESQMHSDQRPSQVPTMPTFQSRHSQLPPTPSFPRVMGLPPGHPFLSTHQPPVRPHQAASGGPLSSVEVAFLRSVLSRLPSH